MRYLGGACDRDEAWRRLAANVGHWVLCGYGPWAIEEKATGDFVGRAGMWRRETWPGPEAVWALTPDKRGRGFATEAAGAVIHFAFETMGLEQVPSIIDPVNAPSIHVAERVGQIHTGDLMRKGTRRLVYTISRQAS